MSHFTVILFFVLSVSASAQSPDSLARKVEAIGSVDLRINDSIGVFTNVLPKGADSLNAIIGAQYASMRYSYDSITSLLDSKSNALKQRSDSLQALGLPIDNVPAELEGLRRQQEELWNNATEKLESMKSAVRDHITKLPPEMSDQTQGLTGLLDKLHMASPLEQLPTSFQGSINVPGVNGSLPGMPNFGAPRMPGLPEIGLPNAEITEVSIQVSQLPSGNQAVMEAVGQKVVETTPLQKVQEEIGKGSELSSAAAGLPDEKEMKEKLLFQMQEEAVNHFAGKETELTRAMETLAKYRKKYGSFQNLEELAFRHRNVLHDAPLIERLVPGLGLQFFHGEVFMVDINPYVGYRFNERFTAGAGWNERVAFGSAASSRTDRVYGPRGYAEHHVWRSMSVHVEVEYLNAFVPTQFSANGMDAAGRQWVFSFLGGIKKEYGFIKNIKGTFYMLYNLHDPFHRSPYTDKLVMKMGFEFPMKKKASGEN